MVPRKSGVFRRSERGLPFLALLSTAILWVPITGSVCAQSAPASSAVPTLAPVVVTGVLPGPALWKVSRGGHVMWVLGLTSPVPKNMQWKSAEVESRLAASQVVLKLPTLEIGVKASAYRDSMLLPPRVQRDNPNQQTLHDVLAPEVYRHWQRLRARYLPTSRHLERMRPIVAGRELYEAALAHYGLIDDYGLEAMVYKAASRDGVTIISTSYRLLLKDPGEAIRSLNNTSMNDQHCLDQVLDALDQDLAQATQRANAWATGDIDALRSILSLAQQDSCLSTLDRSQFAEALGIDDIEGRVKKSWIESAERELEKNVGSFAVLPMHELLATDGYMHALQSDGYSVQSPGQ
jgi:uncharacterized protein YbaP (TraB family)